MKSLKLSKQIGNIDIGFWTKFARMKIETFKLDSSDQPVFGRASVSNRIEPISLLSLDIHSFDPPEPQTQGPFEIQVRGVLRSCNTVEEYTGLEDSALDAMLRAEVERRAQEGLAADSLDLGCFVLAMFADLKKYLFRYRFATNSVKVVGTKTISLQLANAAKLDLQQVDVLVRAYAHRTAPKPFFVLVEEGGKFRHATLAEVKEKPADYLFCLFDSSNNPDNMGIFTHNYLGFLLSLGMPKESLAKVRLLLLKEYIILGLDRKLSWERSVLWEVNLSEAKMGEQCLLKEHKRIELDLKPKMDEFTLAKEAIDLNIKLMKWRLLPQLEIQKIYGTSCLLFGSGTLGCQLARNLIGWGVKKITFIDNGKVSYSNPVRQSLFEYADSIGGGKPKAETAAAKLKAIFPGLQAEGYTINVPMPGHFVTTEEDIKSTLAALEQVEKLVEANDVLYLLMDSREARWLPTVLANKFKKICITVALGFDSFVVIRHGISPLSYRPQLHGDRLSCYFCNDVLAPVNSMRDRTLDQQCTVTKPGLSFISSALASELLMNLLHHPLREGCPASEKKDQLEENALGKIPHHIRGTISDFNVSLYYGKAFDQCIACSEFVVRRYLEKGEGFLLEVINNPNYVHEVTNLKELLDQEVTFESIEVEDGEEIVVIK